MTEFIQTESWQLEESEPLSDRQWQQLQQHSRPFLGKWHRLISATNWDKGAIITAWQQSLAKDGLAKTMYSDARWSELVGGATAQHVGRLRRTFARFGHVYQEYQGLYWSHFYAALDWDDAEMWLEGAIQSSWSVSQMRENRWTAMGRPPADEPRLEQIVISELNEETPAIAGTIDMPPRDYIEGPRPEGPDFGESESNLSTSREVHDDLAQTDEGNAGASERIRPFESFSNLPDDINAAVTAFKIAIIRHKADHWQAISPTDICGLLDALKALAASPNSN